MHHRQNSASSMGGYYPRYADTDEEPVNSRHNPNRTLRRRDLSEDHRYQADTWRPYDRHGSSMHQSAGYNSVQMYDSWRPDHQPYTSRYDLNPAAVPFQPSYAVAYPNPSPSQFRPYEPIRASNGHSERNTVYHSNTRSYSAYGSASPQYPSRSWTHINQRVTRQNAPFYIDHQQRAHISSIPATLPPRPGLQAQEPSVPDLSRPVTPPLAPEPDQAYLTQAALPCSRLAAPQKLLVVLDLNGTLLKRKMSKGTKFTLRPGVTPLVEYLFANHAVMVYTSSRPDNATGMVQKLFSPKQRKKLAAIWARDKLELTKAQYHSKVQIYKKLDKIWNDPAIQRTAGKDRQWDQSNTVLIDDSHLKGLAQPYNLLRVEEFLNDNPAARPWYGMNLPAEQDAALAQWTNGQLSILRILQGQLEELKWTSDVSQLIRTWQLEGNLGVGPEEETTQNAGNIVASGLASSSDDVDMTTGEQIDGKDEDSDIEIDIDASDGSVTPVDENTWKDLLHDIEQRHEKTD